MQKRFILSTASVEGKACVGRQLYDDGRAGRNYSEGYEGGFSALYIVWALWALRDCECDRRSRWRPASSAQQLTSGAPIITAAVQGDCWNKEMNFSSHFFFFFFFASGRFLRRSPPALGHVTDEQTEKVGISSSPGLYNHRGSRLLKYKRPFVMRGGSEAV